MHVYQAHDIMWHLCKHNFFALILHFICVYVLARRKIFVSRNTTFILIRN